MLRQKLASRLCHTGFIISTRQTLRPKLASHVFVILHLRLQWYIGQLLTKMKVVIYIEIIFGNNLRNIFFLFLKTSGILMYGCLCGQRGDVEDANNLLNRAIRADIERLHLKRFVNPKRYAYFSNRFVLRNQISK